MPGVCGAFESGKGEQLTMTTIEGSGASFTLTNTHTYPEVPRALLDEPYSLEWYPRAYPYRLRKEQWLRQERIRVLSCDVRIREQEERLRGITNPIHRGMVEHVISMLRMERFSFFRWAEEIPECGRRE